LTPLELVEVAAVDVDELEFEEDEFSVRLSSFISTSVSSFLAPFEE
jgi:hypothetical protein